MPVSRGLKKFTTYCLALVFPIRSWRSASSINTMAFFSSMRSLGLSLTMKLDSNTFCFFSGKAGYCREKVILLAYAMGNRSVIEPKPTPDEELPPCWRGSDARLFEDRLAEEVFVRLNGLLRDYEGKTKKKLKELGPPLT